MADWGKVDEITERMKLSPTGELYKVYHIRATTAKGISFTHEVPEDQIDLEQVDEALRPKAAKLDALLDL